MSTKEKAGGKDKIAHDDSKPKVTHTKPVPLAKAKPKSKPKTCTGNATGDVIGSVTAHLGLAAAGIFSPPGVQCGTGAADLALTVGEETGVVCGGSLKTDSPVWRGVNIGLASAGAAISCVPIVGKSSTPGKRCTRPASWRCAASARESLQGLRVVHGPLPAAHH